MLLVSSFRSHSKKPTCRPAPTADVDAPEAGCGAVGVLSVPWPTTQLGLAPRAVPPANSERASTEAVTSPVMRPRRRGARERWVARIVLLAPRMGRKYQ